MEIFARNVGHVISYLISEQEKREQLNRAMDSLREDLGAYQRNLTEQTFEIRTIKERSARNGKLLMTVLGSMLSVVALEVLRLALQHIK